MTRSIHRSVLALVAAAPVVLAAPQARAGGDSAAAEALFQEAKKLASEKKYAEACPKFAESNRLDRGAGTMIHLADCYEKNKQTASAWATFREAASAAQALGRADWEKLAAQRANALEPKLAKLTVKVDSPADRIEVKRDDNVVSQASWGVPLPVDVGTHTVEATAPNSKPFKTTVTITKDGEKKDVTVPKLEPLPKAAEPVAAAPTPAPATPGPVDADTSSGSSSQKTIGLVVAGVGVVGLAVGGVTGFMAKGKSDDAKKVCPNDGSCADRSAVDAADSAKSLGTISTIAFAAGGVALVSGVVLILTSPSKTTAVRVVPQAGPSTAGLTFSGAF